MGNPYYKAKRNSDSVKPVFANRKSSRVPNGRYHKGGGDDSNSTLPGRAYLFIFADEILPSGKLVRKVMVAPKGMTSQAYVQNPEIFGFKPRAPGANVSIGEHALGNNCSPYLSASTISGGAPTIEGTSYYIDIKKAQAAGAKIYSTDEIIRDLQRLERQQPHLHYRINKLIGVIKSLEGEVLLHGEVPASAIKSPLSMNLTRGLRGVQFVGFAFSAYDMTQASRESVRTNSIKPLAKESIRQVGGWGASYAGAEIGFMVGAACGIETGPGAIITGAVGALIFGTAGYFGADWIANWSID